MAKKNLFSNRELSDFCGQLTMILNAGMSLSEGITMMEEDSENKAEQHTLSLLREGMDETGIFSDALERSGEFPAYMVKMVRLGEETGHLDDVMEALAQHYDREDNLTKSIRSAVTYPVMMLAMMVLIVIVLLTRVMPIFNQVFLQLGTELTGLSRGLMNLGIGIRRYSLALVAVAVLLTAAGFCAAYTKRGKATASCVFRKVPYIARIYDKIALCRFSSGMALALSSGLNPEYALELVRDLSQDPAYKKRLDQCQLAVDSGEDFSHALLSGGVFTGIYARMAAIGQRTGTMAETMGHIAEDCQDDLDQRIASALSMIEPTLVVVLSVIVGIVLMSVMFPLLSIMSSI